MSIKTLMSAADAAGYVMAVEEELPETFGTQPAIFDFKAQPTTSLAIWRPVVPAEKAGDTPHGHISHAWGWLSGRFAGGGVAA